MLNLSDKELDRFSKEAAQEYEPGDVLGDRSWERLAVHLDRDLGHVSPNPLRHIRRFPFYYAPAMLVLLGVSYYFIRQGTKGSAGPPGEQAKAPAVVVQNPLSTQSQVYSDKSTSASPTVTPANSADYSAGSGGGNGATSSAGSPGHVNGSGVSSEASTAVDSRGHVNGSSVSNRTAVPGGSHGHARGSGKEQTSAAGTDKTDNSGNSAGDGLAGVAANSGASATTWKAGSPRGKSAQGSASLVQTAQPPAAGRPGELSKTALMGLQSTKKAAHVDDSALRAFTLKSTVPALIRNRGLHINRSLEFGVVAAPDFASVNSVAGDRPGSTLGLTVDYQFANRWYIGTGLLLDRKNYGARGQDFHAPPDYFQNIGIHDRVDLIKGSFEMLEIPLNLRYDFSVTGNTLFFASMGLSSYLFASENEGGAGLAARGIVTSVEPSAKRAGIARQTPRVSLTVERTALAKRPLGSNQLRSLTDWNDGEPGTELDFKFYRQATNKIAGISDEAAAFLESFF